MWLNEVQGHLYLYHLVFTLFFTVTVRNGEVMGQI